MGIGAVCYYRKTLDTRTNNQLKSLTYNFTMPVMLFYFMTKTDGQMISYSYVFLIVAYCIIVTRNSFFLINHKYFTKKTTRKPRLHRLVGYFPIVHILDCQCHF